MGKHSRSQSFCEPVPRTMNVASAAQCFPTFGWDKMVEGMELGRSLLPDRLGSDKIFS